MTIQLVAAGDVQYENNQFRALSVVAAGAAAAQGETAGPWINVDGIVVDALAIAYTAGTAGAMTIRFEAQLEDDDAGTVFDVFPANDVTTALSVAPAGTFTGLLPLRLAANGGQRPLRGVRRMRCTRQFASGPDAATDAKVYLVGYAE